MSWWTSLSKKPCARAFKLVGDESTPWSEQGIRVPTSSIAHRSGASPLAHVHASDEPYRTPTMLSQFFAIGSSPQPVMHEGRLWHFSETEKRELGLALGAFTLALGLMSVRGLGGLMGAGTETGLYASGAEWLGTLVLAMPLMAIAIGPAFVLHELGHKFAARHYGCWAEFRSDPKGLRFGVLLGTLSSDSCSWRLAL